MIRDLDVPFADTRADQLRLSLSAPVLAAEFTLPVPTAFGALDLRILRASHQVVVHLPGIVPVVETVTCDGDGVAISNGTTRTSLDGFTHTIDVDVRVYDAADLETMVEQLTDELTDDRSLIGRFPGHRLAITALRLDGLDPLRWRTWHCYPQTAQVVRTSTTLRADSIELASQPSAALGAAQ